MVSSNSPKKQTNKFVVERSSKNRYQKSFWNYLTLVFLLKSKSFLNRDSTVRRICSFVFWENLRTPKSPFENIWPLGVNKFPGIILFLKRNTNSCALTNFALLNIFIYAIFQINIWQCEPTCATSKVELFRHYKV